MLHLKTKRKLISVAVASACAWMVLPAAAQQAQQAQQIQQAPATAPETQVVTVIGFRAAAEDALNIKRSADGFVDAISADGLGRFPDLNVGEALSRIPGVQINRDAADRTATVSLRGLPGTFAMVTLNGLTVADPAISGSTPLGTYSSDVFSRFVVNKSPGASDAAGGLAGNIDLQMSGALARKDGGDIKAAVEYNSLGKSTSPSATIKYNKHLSKDFAVYGTFVYKKELFRRDTFQFNGYSNILDTSNFNNTTGIVNTANQNQTPYVDANAGNGNRPRVMNIADFADYYAAPGSTYVSPAGVQRSVLNLQPGLFTTATTISAANVAANVVYPSNPTTIANGTAGQPIPLNTVLPVGSQIPFGIAGSTSGIGINTPIVGTGKISSTGVQFVNTPLQSSREAKGDNQSSSVGFEYKVNSKLKLGATWFNARRNLDEATQWAIQSFQGSNSRIWVDPASIYLTPDGNAFADRYTYENPQLLSTSQFQFTRSQANALTGTATWTGDDWVSTTNISLSKARGLFNQIDAKVTFNSVGLASNRPNLVNPSNGVYGEFSGGLGDISKTKWTLYPSNPFTVPSAPFRIDSLTTSTPAVVAVSVPSAIRGLSPTGAASAYLQYLGQYNYTDNKVSGIQQDFERNLSEVPYVGRVLRSVQFGAKYERNDFKSTFYRISAWGLNTENITPALLGGTYANTATFSGGNMTAYNTNWQVLNLEATEQALKPTPQSLVPGQQTTPLGFPVEMTPNGYVNSPNDSGAYQNNFTNNYKNLNAYIQGNIETKVFGIPLRGNVGLRQERTEKTIVAVDRIIKTVSGAQIINRTPSTFENKYTYNLPSLMLAAEVKKDLLIRFATYKTYVKPNRYDENPVTSASRTDNLNTSNNTQESTYNISLGKTNLTPYTGISGDIGIEWYNRKGSVIALALFQKNIRGFNYGINKQNGADITCPANGLFNGVSYGTGPLVSNPFATDPVEQCVGSVKVDPVTGQAQKIIVNATGSVNNPGLVKLQGMEINIQQNLSFLPSPWSNFGGAANYSWNKTEGKLANGQRVPITGVARGNYNLVGYYEQGQFGMRLIYNNRKGYASGFGVPFDTLVRPRQQLDGVISWKFKSGAQIALDLYNLTDARVEQYSQDDRALRKVDFDGRTSTLTFRAPF